MSEKTIYIEKVEAQDLEALIAISVDTFYESFRKDNTEQNMHAYINEFFSHNNMEQELNNPLSAFYFANFNGKPIGYLKINVATAQTELKESNSLEIERIYVVHEHRGKQVGQLLFNKALEIAHYKNFDYVWLGVWEKNAGAIRFYERNGMEKFDTHPFMLGSDQQTDHMMKLQLSGKL